MGLFKRMFGIGKSEANAALDKLEDPVKMSEQAIRDMKTLLAKAIESSASVKASELRMAKTVEDYLSKVKSYEDKASRLKPIFAANPDDAATKEALLLALNKIENAKKQADSVQTQLDSFKSKTEASKSQVSKLHQNIENAELELKSLKARSDSANAAKKINKEMSAIDDSSAMAILERMKEKVEQTESEAEAYGEVANITSSADDKMDAVLNANSPTADDDLLSSFMKD